MLELRLSKAPPENSCLIGFYTGTEFDSQSNIGLRDHSHLWDLNRTGFGGLTRAISFDTGGNHDPITAPDLVVGNISARYRNLVEPTPLPWAHRIGSNTALGNKRRYVFSPLTDSINPSTSATMYEALFKLRQGLRILEADGTEADIVWDIAFLDITGAGSRRVAIGTLFGWDFYVLLAEEPTADRPLFLEFTAVDANTNVEYGHRELINAEPYLVSNGIFAPGAGTAAAGEFALESDPDNTYQLISGGDADAMAIALWTDDANWTWERNGADLEFDLSTVLQFSITLTGRTVREVVQLINAENAAVKATLLLDYDDATQLQSVGPAVSIGPDGRHPILFEEHYFVHYKYDTRFFCGKPLQLSNNEEWHPRIRASHIEYEETAGPLTGAVITYTVPETNWVTSRGTELPYVYKEPARVIRPDMIVGRHRGIVPATLIVEIDGHSAMHLIEDYDASNCVIKFSQPIEGADSISLSYEHSGDGWYEIENLDLNPIEKHFEESYRLYIGIYLTPSNIANPPSGPDPLVLKPTVGWIAANTVAEIITAVDAITGPAAFALQAKLIGVFQVSSQMGATDVKVVDVRSFGGGIKDDADIKAILEDNPEAQFYADLGYWDGEPYPGFGVVVVEGPAAIIGTTVPDPAAPSPADGGFVDITGTQSIADIRRRLKKHTPVGNYNIVDLK